MKVQNVTVALPEELIVEAKHLAVDAGLSLSRFVAKALEERVIAARAYEAARDRQLRVLARGFKMGLGDLPTWDRDALHERHA